jgi:hypothetical protein
MNKEDLVRDISSSLASIQLDSRSSSRFRPVQELIAKHLGLVPAQVVVKSLTDSKNYGNRLSEATGGSVTLLVLVAVVPVNLSTLQRAISARCVRLVPSLLVCRSPSGWIIEAQFLPSTLPDVIPGVRTVRVTRPTLAAHSIGDSTHLERRLQALNGMTDAEHLTPILSELISEHPGLAIKRVASAKNLRNRIREATGRRPSHLLIIVPEGLIQASRTALETDLGAEHPTVRFLLWVSQGVVQVERLSAPDRGGEEALTMDKAQKKRQHEAEIVMGIPDGNEYRQLERVKQLLRLLPLDANAKDLFEEHIEGPQRIAYETTTFGYLRRLLARDTRTVIVLTGNAGHGKTHMCRRLLEQDHDPDTVMDRLQQDKEGRSPWDISGIALPIRVVKDLSEIEPPEHAAALLVDLISQSESHVIVCANEGRLRAVVSENPGILRPVLDALDRGLAHGETSPNGDTSIHVVNLNFQAAVVGEKGFFEHVLMHFLDNQTAWNVCNRCQAQNECPIYANRMDLSVSPSVRRANRNARHALRDLIRITEESGYVLTFREVLVLVAFLVTGGLSCGEVEERHRDGRRRDGLSKYRLLEVLFNAPLNEDQAEVLRILQRIRLLDPGRIALRSVDEELHRSLETNGQLGAGVFGDDSVQPKTKRDRDREVDQYRAVIRNARRMAWLNSGDDDQARLGISRSERLGLAHHDLFRSLQDNPEPSAVVGILRRLVKGLHTIQGALSVDSKTNLHLVDPAFGRSGSHSAVISRSLRIKDLDLVTESTWWRRRRGETTPPVLEAVDWIDRRLLLVDMRSQEVLLPLDLAAFEFVVAAAEGIVMREFHAAQRRRILARLASLAEKSAGESADEIRVLLDRGDGTLTVERDGTILLERN